VVVEGMMAVIIVGNLDILREIVDRIVEGLMEEEDREMGIVIDVEIRMIVREIVLVEEELLLEEEMMMILEEREEVPMKGKSLLGEVVEMENVLVGEEMRMEILVKVYKYSV